MGQSPGSLRLLAPVALVVFAIIFLIVVTSSLSGGGDRAAPVDLGTAAHKAKKDKDIGTSTSTSTTGELGTDTTGTASTTDSTTPTTTKSSYTVKPGDTLEAISAKTGVSVDELARLNPDVDPQALVAGSKLKLTE